VQNAVPPQDMGVATSSATFFRQMGGTLGTAVFLSVLFSTVGGRISSAFKTASTTPDFTAALSDPSVTSDPANQPVLQAIKGGAGLPKGALDDTSFLNRIDARLARPFLEGFTSSIDLVFLCGAGVLVFAAVIVFFLPEEKLRSMSGIEARRQQDARTAKEAEAAGTLTATTDDDARPNDRDVTADAAAVTTGSSQMVDGETVDRSVDDVVEKPV
jgi:hypothetical protein